MAINSEVEAHGNMWYEQINQTNYFPFKLFLFESKETDRLIATHWHESTELIYCVEGELNARVSNTLYHMEAGDVLMINSNIAHSTWSPTENKVLVIQFPKEMMEKLSLGVYGKSKVIKIDPSVRNENKENYPRLINILTKIILDYENTNDNNYWKIMSNIYLLFEIITNHFMVDYSENNKLMDKSKSLVQMQAIVEYIQENYQENLTLDQISSFFNYNSSYFSRIFKKNFGVNYSDYLKSVRLEKSYKLLQNKNLSIITIALDVGFNSSKAFNTAFKKKFGYTPHQYRLLFL